MWSQEAFPLWLTWAGIYDDDSASCQLLYDIHDTHYLVAVIDNDYIDSDLYAVFDEAMRAQTESTASQSE